MKHRASWAAAAFASVLSAAWAAPAWAAPTLFAELDRTSFRHTVLDTDLADGIAAGWTMTWWDRSVEACQADAPNCVQSTTDPLQTVTAQTETPAQRQYASSAPDRIYAEVEGTHPHRGGGPGAEANMQQHLVFSGAGRHTFEVDYLVGGAGFGESSGSAQATLSLNGWEIQYASDSLWLGPTFSDGSRRGTLSLTVDVLDGQHGTLMTYAWATIHDGPVAGPVPEPATLSLALMGAGLAVVGARRRRR